MSEEEKEIIKEIDDLLEYMQEEFEARHSCFNKREYQAVKGLLDLYYKQQKEIAQKDNIIDAMAEQLTTPVHNRQWVIDYFEEKIK